MIHKTIRLQLSEHWAFTGQMGLQPQIRLESYFRNEAVGGSMTLDSSRKDRRLVIGAAGRDRTCDQRVAVRSRLTASAPFRLEKGPLLLPLSWRLRSSHTAARVPSAAFLAFCLAGRYLRIGWVALPCVRRKSISVLTFTLSRSYDLVHWSLGASS